MEKLRYPSIGSSLSRYASYTNQELEKKREAHSADASLESTWNEASQVDHPAFDVFFACVVLLNSILIGVDVENTLSCRDQPVCDARPGWLQATQISCTVLFVLELVIRVTASGIQIFCSEDWLWILLDVLIVALSVWEIVVDIALLVEPDQEAMNEGVSGIASLKAFRIIRLTRILKTAQLMRVFRFVMALRTLVQSVLHTLKALMWALLLLLLIVYVFAVLFTQAIHDHIYVDMLPMPADAEVASDRYFGSLLDSMLSLFMSIAGGVSWEEVLLPLRHVSSAWIWTFCFIFYISFTYFAVLNVVTAVFCQSAIESAQNDHATVVQNMLDNKESHLKKLRALFSKFDIQANGGITYGMFEEKLDSPAVREYFETLGLDVWDAWSFFKLLDQDGGGLVEIEEFFMGCLRFSGHARAMDVGKIIQDQGWIIRNQGRFHSYVEGELHKLHEHMNSLAVFLGSISRGFTVEGMDLTVLEVLLRYPIAQTYEFRVPSQQGKAIDEHECHPKMWTVLLWAGHTTRTPIWFAFCQGRREDYRRASGLSVHMLTAQCFVPWLKLQFSSLCPLCGRGSELFKAHTCFTAYLNSPCTVFITTGWIRVTVATMFRNVAYIQFCLLVAALGTADTAGHVPVTTEDEPIACPVGMGALRKALASFDLKDPSRLMDMAVSSFLPDLMALLAAALFFYFLNLVLVVPKRRKPRTEPLEDSEDEPQSQAPEISGCTALHLAAHNGCARELGALIDSGLDVNAVDSYNETALHMAARVGRVDICTMLLEAGVDPEVQNKNLKTAFLVAAISGHSEVCDLLRPGRKTRKAAASKEKSMPKLELDEDDMLSEDLAEFSDLYQPSEEAGFGASELHDAALVSSLGQVLALLRRGAEVNCCDPWGETALHMAARVGSLEICAALCAARADPTMRNKDNNSALDVANVSQNQDICKLLQDDPIRCLAVLTSAEKLSIGQRDHVEIVTGHTILSLSRGGQGFQRAAEIRTHRYHLANNLIRQLMRRFVSVKSVKVEKLLPLTRGLGIFHKTEGLRCDSKKISSRRLVLRGRRRASLETQAVPYRVIHGTLLRKADPVSVAGAASQKVACSKRPAGSTVLTLITAKLPTLCLQRLICQSSEDDYL
ncbi:Ankyrin-1 [Symbiodinium microadriaticum]|uniref:Ankyrin-1 n=1 Tax=Symbiodinium microadriaticum TaxID=2951 RepID=A0A1Q9EGK5_SYMMI|nr:Ankyrin-1 [Symbiodinium microadriaticum]